MNISSLNSTLATGVSSSHNPGVKAGLSTQLNQAELRQFDQNRSILESQQSVSLGIKNEPLALILKTALDAINEQLQPLLGDNAIESAVERGVDVSPEATAGRIVDQSSAFFSAFQRQNQQLNPQQQLEKFLEVIGSGIDQGFKEARDILDGLSVLQGEIAANIDKTYELVQSGLEDFRQRQIDTNTAVS